MEHVATTIFEDAIYMRYADSPDPDEATTWVEFQVPLEPLTLPYPNGDVPLGDPQSRYLASIRQAALRYVQDVIADETQRLADQRGRPT
jgi:hypothetical protein